MTKICKISNKSENTRKRVQIFRGIQSILRQDRNVNQANRDQNSFNVPNNVCNFTENVRQESQKSLANNLRNWAIEYHIKQRAISSLLKILKISGMSFLPKDSRTLLRTPQVIEIENKADGKFWYNGIRHNLNIVFHKLTSNFTIDMAFNVDGLPLFKSSPIQFWPILANIQSTYFEKTNGDIF